MIQIRKSVLVSLLSAVFALLMLANGALAQDAHTTTKFSGAKVNAGSVTHTKEGNKSILTLSADFTVPDTPDPHWQVIDSKGNVFELDKLKVKSLLGDKVKRQITLPDYIHDVAKVQIYCAWAEAVLGEASFSSPVM